MLTLHFSNRYEVLAQRLLAQLGGARADAFGADPVIVPSTAVRRALTLALADAQGICANIRFDFLAQWLWRQIGRVLPDVMPESPFTAVTLTWRIYALFGDAGYLGRHPRLAGYLQRADEPMRFELAQQVARLLEQYTTYRPDWLHAWQQGHSAGLGDLGEAARADERWQAELWRRIAGQLQVGAVHPAAAFVQALEHGGHERVRSARLPERVHVFALPALPPLHLQLLEQMARWIEIDVYVLNPCQEYWFEVIDRHRLSYLATRGRAAGHEEGNRLLAAWGRQTQAHIEGLVALCGESATEDSAFAPNAAACLLAQLQNAILELSELAPGSIAAAPQDRSIEVHVCHGLSRELEVLQDRLLGLFAADDSLQPADILVVTPDLESAAPLIEAVFGTAPAERRIPFAITGQAPSTVNAPARALLALLALAASRFAASDVFGVLQQPIVARRQGLDDAALAQIHEWMLASGIHWGLDAGHRAGFGVPAGTRHTLSDGLERLFLGYALPDALREPFQQRLPAGAAQGSAAGTLGAFWHFAAALQRLQRETGLARTPASWCDLLLGALDDFLAAAADEVDDLGEVRAAIAALYESMQHGGLTQPVPFAVVRSALHQLLDEPARAGVPTGAVTFSTMGSLRNLPYRVVCAIGLNDGAFPGSARAPEFDLMAAQPRRGDRQRRNDERNLFLDLLLAARATVHLSYTGRSVHDNASLPPCVLVSELLDVLVPAIAADPASAVSLAQARARLVVEHPLQPFSFACFDTAGAELRVRSFNRELAEALRQSLAAPERTAAASTSADGAADHAYEEPEDASDADTDAAADTTQTVAFFRRALTPAQAEWREVSVEQLVEFFRNPCRYLLKRRLGIELRRAAEELLDDEPFLPDWPARAALAQRLLPALLQGVDQQTAQRLARAGTEWPDGALGQSWLDSELPRLDAFAARVRAATAQAALAPHTVRVAVELDAEHWRLHGAYSELRPGGLVRWRYDELRAATRLEAWIHHLALAADPPAAMTACTRVLTLDDEIVFRAPDAPVEQIRTLLRLYRRGLSEPLPFFPKTAWSYLEDSVKDGAKHPLKNSAHPDGARAYHANRASQAWYPTPQNPHAEGDDPAYRLALRGQREVLGEDFRRVAAQVFEPVLRHLERRT